MTGADHSTPFPYTSVCTACAGTVPTQYPQTPGRTLLCHADRVAQNGSCPCQSGPQGMVRDGEIIAVGHFPFTGDCPAPEGGWYGWARPKTGFVNKAELRPRRHR